MKPQFVTLLIFACFLFPVAAWAQGTADDTLKAEQCLSRGKELVDSGKYEEGIEQYKMGQKLVPGAYQFPYETAYAYQLQEKFQDAIDLAEPLLKLPKSDPMVYDLVGSCYDYLKNPEKAIEIYEAGRQRFPMSGRMYLELGVMKLHTKDYDTALSYFEHGIGVDPEFPSNYFWASQLLFEKSKIWCWIYGETFLNLEPTTKRANHISEMLYNLYVKNTTFGTDSGKSTVKFDWASPANVTFGKKGANATLIPFESAVESSLGIGAATEKKIDLDAVIRIREAFVDVWFKQFAKNYPENFLFEHEKKVIAAGFGEPYSRFVCGVYDDSTIGAWVATHKELFNNFLKWFQENRYDPTRDRFNTRSQFPNEIVLEGKD
jgi:tetratricopeptide (TPR) repeat protein